MFTFKVGILASMPQLRTRQDTAVSRSIAGTDCPVHVVKGQKRITQCVSVYQLR